jgi:hypothetical protein
MRSLSELEVLDLVDTGRLLSAEERALSILRMVSGESEETLSQLPRARLDALLIDARAETIGSRLEACVTCGECGTLLEASVECRALIAEPPDAFELVCDHCNKRSSSVFDIRAFFWRELSARAQQIVLDVHDLARAYGWRESDVLSLSPARRRRYLELVGEPRPFETPRDEEWEVGVERAASVAVARREPDGDGSSNTPGGIRRAVLDAENTPPPSSRTPEETVANPPIQERTRRHHAGRVIADGVNRGLAATPARVVAAASRRETATTNSPMSAMPQVTVNIARIDVVATPAQAATIGARQKRCEAAMPLSVYLADRETETR